MLLGRMIEAGPLVELHRREAQRNSHQENNRRPRHRLKMVTDCAGNFVEEKAPRDAHRKTMRSINLVVRPGDKLMQKEKQRRASVMSLRKSKIARGRAIERGELPQKRPIGFAWTARLNDAKHRFQPLPARPVLTDKSSKGHTKSGASRQFDEPLFRRERGQRHIRAFGGRLQAFIKRKRQTLAGIALELVAAIEVAM